MKQTITHSYDAEGQRIQTALIKGSNITAYSYNSLQLLQMRALENNSTETILAYFYNKNEYPHSFISPKEIKQGKKVIKLLPPTQEEMFFWPGKRFLR